MGKKAIDVVLLPEGAMAGMAIEANGVLVERFGRAIVLDEAGCRPHISLSMGCIEDGDIGRAKGLLERIAGGNPLGELVTAGMAVNTNAVGEKVSAIVVAKTRVLQRLHEKVMEGFGPLFSYDVTVDMLYPGEEILESSLLWIKYYREKSAFRKFLPHITIGYGQLEEVPGSMRFRAERIAMCHLGNHCTCREVLASVEL
jgi:hypothetical protein